VLAVPEGESAHHGASEEAMTTSTDPVSPENGIVLIQSAAPPEWDGAATNERSVDLYADSELQLRHERTERMIRRAEEQAT
jgi:hypothetical protein